VKKKISILLVLAMVLTLIPMTAFAGITKSGSVATVADDSVVNLGQARIEIPAGSLSVGDELIISLPSKVTFLDKFTGGVEINEAGNDLALTGVLWNYVNTVAPGVKFYGELTSALGTEAGTSIRIPATNANGNANALYTAAPALDVTTLGNGEFKLTVTAAATTLLSEDSTIFFNLGAVAIEDGFEGPINLNVLAPNGSGFPAGTVTVGTVATSGKINVSTSSTKTSSDNFTFRLNLQELLPGSLKNEAQALKIKLPNGYKFTQTPAAATATISAHGGTVVYGQDLNTTISYQNNNTEMVIRPATAATTQASFWRIPAIGFRLDDVTKAQAGDIMAQIYGASSTDVTEIKVGTFGEFGVQVTEKEVKDVVAGKVDQEIGSFFVEELMSNSLVTSRNVILELPEGVIWDYNPDASVVTPTVDDYTNYHADIPQFANKGVTLNGGGAAAAQLPSIVNSGRELRYIVSNTSDKAKLEIKDLKVAIRPDFEGDLVVKVRGTAGAAGEVKVANVVPSVTAEISEVKEVVIGRSSQKIADITITEALKEAFSNVSGATNIVELELPVGFEFTRLPKVEVVEGDLDIHQVGFSSNNANTLVFNVRGESNKPSTIKVSDVELTTFRHAPEGNVTLTVSGGDLVETDAHFANHDVAAEVVIAKVITPAQGQDGKFEDRQPVTFTIGQKSYVVGNEVVTADVAPFIQDSRTMVPVRFVAQAVGVSESNIIWDDATRTVTIFGERVVQLTIGSSELLVNGAKVTMDTQAIISADRTYVPIAFIAQALGVEYTWNAADMSVTFE